MEIILNKYIELDKHRYLLLTSFCIVLFLLLVFLIFFFTTTVGAHVESFVSSTLFLYYCAHTVKMQMYNRPKFETEDEDAEKLLPVTLLFSRPYCMLF